MFQAIAIFPKAFDLAIFPKSSGQGQSGRQRDQHAQGPRPAAHGLRLRDPQLQDAEPPEAARGHGPVQEGRARRLCTALTASAQWVDLPLAEKPACKQAASQPARQPASQPGSQGFNYVRTYQNKKVRTYIYTYTYIYVYLINYHMTSAPGFHRTTHLAPHGAQPAHLPVGTYARTRTLPGRDTARTPHTTRSGHEPTGTFI